MLFEVTALALFVFARFCINVTRAYRNLNGCPEIKLAKVIYTTTTFFFCITTTRYGQSKITQPGHLLMLESRNLRAPYSLTFFAEDEVYLRFLSVFTHYKTLPKGYI